MNGETIESQERGDRAAFNEGAKRLAAARWLAAYANLKDATDYAVAVGRDVKDDADHGFATDSRITEAAERVFAATTELIDARRVYEESLS